MKTKEFIKRIEELGFNVEEGDNCTHLMVFHDGRRVLEIYDKSRYVINTDLYGFKILKEEVREELFDIAIDYASTPIEEREEPKKYYLRLPDFIADRSSYLNFVVESEEYIFNEKYDGTWYRTQFTQEEINNLPNQEFIKTLIKEEVEE